jgi:hypothetical protein
MKENEYTDYHNEVAEILDQFQRGDYIDYTVPIDGAVAWQFKEHLEQGIIELFRFYEDRHPGVLYEAQRECHPEGLYRNLADKFHIASLQQGDTHVRLNRREVNALGQTLMNEHSEYDSWLGIGTSEDQQRHKVEATMFLELAENFVDVGGSYDPFYEEYFVGVSTWLWECDRDNPEDIFGGDYEL